MTDFEDKVFHLSDMACVCLAEPVLDVSLVELVFHLVWVLGVHIRRAQATAATRIASRRSSPALTPSRAHSRTTIWPLTNCSGASTKVVTIIMVIT